MVNPTVFFDIAVDVYKKNADCPVERSAGILPLLLQGIGNLFKVLAFYESEFVAPDLTRGFNKG
ncbi:hypothetical protein PRBEI_2000250700 [Prionailurus iriomotensis]